MKISNCYLQSIYTPHIHNTITYRQIPAKKISSAVLSIILIILTLMISYFLNLQIEYIRFDSNQIFAILQYPKGIAADNAGYVYVIDAETESKKIYY